MKSIRILLVDDDSPLLQTLADYLTNNLEVTVYTAASVPAAISEIDQHGPFDIMISDYQLPPHTANDLANYMKSAQIDTPLILHSAFTEIDERSFLKERNYIGLVPKPGHRELVKLILTRYPGAKKADVLSRN